MKEKVADLVARLEGFRPARPSSSDGTFALDGLRLSEEDITRTLVEHRPPPLLFRHAPAERVMRDFEEIGILRRVAERGYRDVRPSFDGDDPFENRFRLLATHPRGKGDLVLMELRTRQGELVAESPVSDETFTVRALMLEWVLIQDPVLPLSPERALPGQSHPGLGIFGAAFGLVLRYFAEMPIDVVVNVPEYFHNAVLYAPAFQFFLPRREGSFQALKRDLLSQGLARASRALCKGTVFAEPGGRPTTWQPSEQIHAVREPMGSYFKSEAYRQAVRHEREASAFRPASDEGA